MERVHRLERRKIRIATRALSERRRWRRVALPLDGRMLLETGRECRVEVIDVSAGGVYVRSDLRPRLAGRVVLIIDEIGRLEVDVVRKELTRFAGTIKATGRKRDRLADALMWIKAQRDYGLRDDRRAPREGRSGRVRSTFADGVITQARLIDASTVGVSVAAVERPKLGEGVCIDGRPGRVARLHDAGFAVAYDISEAPAA
jgi:hypothetical protein